MPEDARFGAGAGHAGGEQADAYGFFAPVRTAAPVADGMPATPGGFGGPVPPAPVAPPARPGLPVWAVVLIGVGGMVVLVIVASVALPAFLSSQQHSPLAATTVSTPGTLLGAPKSADPAIASRADQLAADLPSMFGRRLSAGYADGSSTLVVAAAKAPHVLTLAEQQSLTRSFWAHEADSVPDGSSLAAPSTPAGAGVTGTLTCADQLTADGTATVCIDAQATALVVFVLSSTSDSGPDPAGPAQVPPAVVRVS